VKLESNTGFRNMKLRLLNVMVGGGCLLLAVMPRVARAAASTNADYTQMNLVSDLATNATHTDARLLNPWGIVAGPNVVWLNDNHSGLITAYSPAGKPDKFAVSVPAPGGGAGAPSGLVFNDTRQFVVSNGRVHAPATFLIATEDGTIAAWNHPVTGTNAVIVVDRSGSNAVYKGLALAQTASGAPQIYAANFHAGSVDVFDAQFHFVQSFSDTNLPALFAPFNVRTIRGRLFVTFAKQKLPNKMDDEAGPGNGYLDIFDTDGTLLRSFASGGALNSPWGLAVAPMRFGKFSHALLVGNFGDGRINGYDLLTGKLLGHLTRADGTDLAVPGLWALGFERDEIFEHESDFRAQRLYFTAGPHEETDGLLGLIRPVSPLAAPAR
jgi:uncharacterized protein (TIGR03118 family)